MVVEGVVLFGCVVRLLWLRLRWMWRLLLLLLLLLMVTVNSADDEMVAAAANDDDDVRVLTYLCGTLVALVVAVVFGSSRSLSDMTMISADGDCDEYDDEHDDEDDEDDDDDDMVNGGVADGVDRVEVYVIEPAFGLRFASAVCTIKPVRCPAAVDCVANDDVFVIRIGSSSGTGPVLFGLPTLPADR